MKKRDYFMFRLKVSACEEYGDSESVPLPAHTQIFKV